MGVIVALMRVVLTFNVTEQVGADEGEEQH